MAVAKTIEIIARSATSFEDAIAQGITTAGESVHAIREAWVQDQKVHVEEGRIRDYQVSLKITFVVD